MNYLIKGGEFNNKGAEAMTLVAISNIYKIDRKARIFILLYNSTIPFTFIPDCQGIYPSVYFLDYWFGIYNKLRVKNEVKDFIKIFIPGKRSYYINNHKYAQILNNIDITIDVSGFALGDSWSEEQCVSYCNWIKALKKKGSKVFLMPQSFGPFSFKQSVMKHIVDSLSLCDLIYAREQRGYEALSNLHLDNIKLCLDSVLLEKDYDPENIIKGYNQYVDEYALRYEHNIGIIPNIRLYDKGKVEKDRLIMEYEQMINHVLKNQSACVFLIAHANEDLLLCNSIKRRFNNEDRVILIDKVLHSFNYQKLAKQLDYIIASRYHSIVHAYKVGTPAIILGWAVKYDDLATVFDQRKYLIDPSKLESAIKTIDQMEEKYELEREQITTQYNKLSNIDCYSFLRELV